MNQKYHFAEWSRPPVKAKYPLLGSPDSALSSLVQAKARLRRGAVFAETHSIDKKGFAP